MEIKKTIKGISPTGKILIGALLIGGAIWAWWYLKKKNEALATPTNQPQAIVVDQATFENANNNPTPPATDEQAKADAIAKDYVMGRAAGLPENIAKNDSINSQLTAMGYKVSCITTGAGAYLCTAVKI